MSKIVQNNFFVKNNQIRITRLNFFLQTKYFPVISPVDFSRQASKPLTKTGRNLVSDCKTTRTTTTPFRGTTYFSRYCGRKPDKWCSDFDKTEECYKSSLVTRIFWPWLCHRRFLACAWLTLELYFPLLTKGGQVREHYWMDRPLAITWILKLLKLIRLTAGTLKVFFFQCVFFLCPILFLIDVAKHKFVMCNSFIFRKM